MDEQRRDLQNAAALIQLANGLAPSDAVLNQLDRAASLDGPVTISSENLRQLLVAVTTLRWGLATDCSPCPEMLEDLNDSDRKRLLDRLEVLRQEYPDLSPSKLAEMDSVSAALAVLRGEPHPTRVEVWGDIAKGLGVSREELQRALAPKSQPEA